MPTVKTLIKRARKHRIAERVAAEVDPNLNLLAGYPDFLKLIRQLLRDDDEGSEALFEPEALSVLVKRTHRAMHSIWTSQAARTAVDDIQADVWELAPQHTRHSLGPEACRDVGELALRDAMLAGVVFWLHDTALARTLQKPRTKGASWSAPARQKASATTKAARSKRRGADG